MNIITKTATNLFGAFTKRVHFAKFEVHSKAETIAFESFPMPANQAAKKQIAAVPTSSLARMSYRAPGGLYVPSRTFTGYHQSLLFRTTMKRRMYKNPTHQLQKRAFCTQKGSNTVRDIINAGPFARVNTGNIVKISGGGMLISLFAAIVGWAYCDNHPDKEICESIRTYFGIKKRINHIPFTCSHYSPRKTPKELVQKLFSEGHSVVAIIGDPASGKTELGKQYARECKDKYHHIWFVQVETWEKAYRDLAKEWKLFSEEDIAIAGGIEKVAMDLIIHKVHHSFTFFGRKNLIIFDNAPEGFIESQLKWQLPTQTDILLTSRSSNWEQKVNLSSDKNCILTLDEGVQILQSWIGVDRLDLVEAKKIIQRFNYSPVPIAQSGSYLRKSNEDAKEYLSLFEKKKKEILRDGKLKGDIDIVVSLELAISQAAKVEPTALTLLQYCAFLPAKNIPKDLLEKLFDSDRALLNRCLVALDTLIVSDSNQVSINDLFQEIIEEQMQTQKMELLSKLGRVSGEYKDFLLGAPKKAIPIFEQSLKEEKQKTNPDKEKIAEILEDLGFANWSFGNCRSSLQYYVDSLNHLREIYPDSHPRMVPGFGNIGNRLKELGRYQEALESCQTALDILYKTTDKDSPTIAACLINIGGILALLHEHETAWEYYSKALKILRKNNENEKNSVISSMIATTCGNVGMSLGVLGIDGDDLELKMDALQWDFAALEIKKQIYGKDHPILGHDYTNIAWMLNVLDLHQEALKYGITGIELQEKALGDQHPEVAWSYRTAASILRELDLFEQALIYLNKSLAIDKKAFGEFHYKNIVTYNEMGLNLDKLGRKQEALGSKKKALEVAKKNEDKDLLFASYLNIIWSLWSLGQYQETLEYIQEALISLEEHPKKEDERLVEALIYSLDKASDQQLYKKVEREMLPLFVEKLGEDHPLIIKLKTCLK